VTGQVQLPTQVFSPAGGTYQTAQTVTLNTATSPAGATLRYTTDGTIPTENSAAYTAPINLPLNSNTTIRVKAFKADWTPSETVAATYVITGQISFNTPVFTPAAGTYQTAQNVIIAGTIPSDATIRYTTDGSEPTASSPIYSAPINLPLNTSTTIKVKAFKADWTASETHSASYTITGQASIAAPIFSPEPGTYNTLQQVSINTSTVPANARIHYTTDGSDPSASSPIYGSPINIGLNSNVTIKVRAFATDWNPSQIYTGNYVVTGTVDIPEPVFSPAAGTYTSNIQVVLNTQTDPPGATLRYSLDGSEPIETHPAYTQPIQLQTPGDYTLKVRAFKADWLPSQTHTAQYSLTGQIQLMPPYLSPAPGTYTEPINVTSVGGTNPSGGIIRYTIDGSIPTESSPVFDAPIEIGLNTIDVNISIRAFKDGWIPSTPQTGVYSVTGQVELPEILFSPAAGTYQTAQSVSFAEPILPANTTIRYTLDGSEPTAFSAAYVTPIQLPLNSVTTLKAKGFAEGWIPSATKTAVYTITGTLSPPAFSPAGGVFGAPIQVVISAPGEDVSIHYTTDGSEPTQDSPVYSQPITVPNYAQNMVISARAFKDGWTPSSVTSASYSIFSAPVNTRGINYAGFIRVLWNMPGSGRTLQGFNVYRRALDETDFTQLNILPVNDQLDGNYYYDDYNISMDVSYEYYVTAIYDNEESPPSASTVQQYQTQDLDISDASYAWPNPATNSAEIVVVLNRNKDVTLTISIFDFSGKKVRTITTPPQDSNRIRIPWDLKNANGSKVGRGTYFARVVANDGVNRSEYVIKIAVK
ncbi:MAG: T9SS type A sorting domain-containing protein, partial [Candidatus Cloacimonetes bacterium]|nr:T9SS type A sorting domain-containing protein [Candidatus Cloacimonadota bacterium]